MKVRPLHDELDYEQALAEVRKLWDAADGTPQADLLEVWSVLIEDYERKHHAIVPPDPVDAVSFRMDQEQLTQSAVAKLTGIQKPHLSEVLNRRRPLSLAMIRAFHQHLGVPLESLIADTMAA